MHRINRLSVFLAMAAMIFIYSCKSKDTGKSDDKEVVTTTPVTVTNIIRGSLEEDVELNATATYQLKIPVKSNTNGYVKQTMVKLNQFVRKGDLLFVLQTKEANTLERNLHRIDTVFWFNGIVNIFAPESGYISQINDAASNFTQEGEVLATINDANSFGFVLELPFELRPLLPKTEF